MDFQQLQIRKSMNGNQLTFYKTPGRNHRSMRFFENKIASEQAVHPMRVLAAGLPRCATSSIQNALESSYICLAPCMHFASIAPSTTRGDLVLAALHEKDTARRHKLLHHLLHGFQAAADFPTSIFMDDLMDMYPDAAIVLNKRPGGGQQWAPSMRLLTFAASPVYRGLCVLWKTDRNVAAMWDGVMALCQTKLNLTAEELLTVKHYEAHNAWVRAEATKRGRAFLEFEPGDGWEPLCKLVGKPAPTDVPFPFINDASEVRLVVKILYARGAISWLVLGALVFGLGKVLMNRQLW